MGVVCVCSSLGTPPKCVASAMGSCVCVFVCASPVTGIIRVMKIMKRKQQRLCNGERIFFSADGRPTVVDLPRLVRFRFIRVADGVSSEVNPRDYFNVSVFFVCFFFGPE